MTTPASGPSRPSPTTRLATTVPTIRTPLQSPSVTSPLSASNPRYSPSSYSVTGNDEPLVLEIGSRFLRMGFAGEGAPRCVLPWDEGLFSRTGERVEFRSVGARRGRELYGLGTAGRPGGGDDDDEEGEIGLMQDRLERGIRLGVKKYMLIDSNSKYRKFVLPVPPLFPTRLLRAALVTLFEHFTPLAITLHSAPVLATVAAGLRNALVVDIGFHEAVVTPVFELRAIEGRGLGVQARCRRGVRTLRGVWEEVLRESCGVKEIALEELEEVMERCGFVRRFGDMTRDEVAVEVRVGGESYQLPVEMLARPAEVAFFGGGLQGEDPDEYPDDDDTPLPLLLYNTLLRCPVDVRATCMARIVFVGGGANIPGLKARVVEELREIVKKRGWDLCARPPGGGRNANRVSERTFREPIDEDEDKKEKGSDQKGGKREKDGEGKEGKEGKEKEEKEKGDKDEKDEKEEKEGGEGKGGEEKEKENNGEEEKEKEKEKDEGGEKTEERVTRERVKYTPQIKATKSLGVWVGGSFVAGFHVKGRVELEREKFTQDIAKGLSGLPQGF